jgi:hypothetical protein
MPKVVDELPFQRSGTKRVYIFCPGCVAQTKSDGLEGFDGLHCLNITTIHKFNGDYERPTFEPSLMAPKPNGQVCHSFIRGGMIEYLSDSTHPLKGQTVPLLDVPEIYLTRDASSKVNKHPRCKAEGS